MAATADRFLELCRSLKIVPRSVVDKLKATWLAQVTQDLLAEQVLHECRVARPRKKKTGRKQNNMAINRRGRPSEVKTAETTTAPLADTPAPSNDPLVGLGLGNAPAPAVDTAAPLPADNPLAGLLGISSLTSAPPTPVAGLQALKGSVDAAVVKASLGLTGGTGPDPIILQALQDIQMKLDDFDLSEVAIKVQIPPLQKQLDGLQAHMAIMEKAIMTMGAVLKEVHDMLTEAVAPTEQAPIAKAEAVASTVVKEHKPSMLSIEVINTLMPMLQEQRKAVPAFALNWKAQAATIFPALSQATSQKLGKEVSAAAVEHAFREFGKLDEASGLVLF